MKKLKLEIDSLEIESFSTAAGQEPAGTVEAHATRNQNTCGATCDASCFGSCDHTCDYTCKCVFTEPRQTCLEPCVPPPID